MDYKHISMNIVNQLYDLAEVPVEKRQAINDESDAFVERLLRQYCVISSLPLLKAVMEEIKSTDADFFGGEYEKQAKINWYQSIIQFISELESEGQ